MSDKRPPLNEHDFFWKNWRLGTELQIAGTSIYNALYFLDTLEYIHYEEDIFEFLYNLSIGIERLQKITIILLDHDENTNQEEFEDNLKTHDHIKLQDRINKIRSINLGKTHYRFLNILRDFYTNYRYERFNKKSIYKPNFDKKLFQEFLVRELNLPKTTEEEKKWYPYRDEEWVENTERVKNFIGKAVGKIVTPLYEIICDRAREIGTYTYEIRYASKAYKIFMAGEFTFEIENNFKKEIIIGLLNKDCMDDEFKKYIQSLEPIDFDQNNSSYYIQYLINSFAESDLISEYEYLIDEKEITKERLIDIDPIGTRINLDFGFDDNEDDDLEQ